jgi:hypothetical protein
MIPSPAPKSDDDEPAGDPALLLSGRERLLKVENVVTGQARVRV